MVPGDSRTSVQHTTCLGLTAGFGMRPGVSRKLWPLSPHVVFFPPPDCLTQTSESQGPDLNWSVVDLQSTAWPLRHLGSRVSWMIPYLIG